MTVEVRRKAAEDFREAILLGKSGKDAFSNRARSLVIAIKRSLEQEKRLKGAKGKAELPKKKTMSPLGMMGKKKR